MVEVISLLLRLLSLYTWIVKYISQLFAFWNYDTIDNFLCN